MNRVGRSTFRKLYWGPLLCLFVVFVFSAAVARGVGGRPPGLRGQPFLMVLTWVFLVWVLLGRRIAYLLVPLFVSTLSCPGCEEELDAVDVWDCSCGFRPRGER